jgi:shikimate dehydrogenase
MTDRYCVLGNPVAHSRSPAIHARFAEQCAQDLSYEALLAPLDGFAGTVAQFVAAGGKGANVTVPFKEEAFRLSARRSARAERAAAVNTLVFGEDGIFGDNTDGAGLVRDLTDRNALDLRGRRTLLLGAGGAAHGIAPALLDAGIGDLFIVNRNADRADALVDALGQPGSVHSRYWEDMASLGAFDFIINATSAGRESGTISLPFGIATPRTLAVDLNYGEAAIAFLAWARSAHCQGAIDGLGMLVEQAAESFESWHGVRPLTDAIYAELRSQSLVFSTGD